MVKIFIGNVADGARNSELKTMFEKYGAVSECSILTNFGFVHMDAEDDAYAAVKGLDGAFFAGATIKVEISHGKTSRGRGRGGPRGRGRGGFDKERRYSDFGERDYYSRPDPYARDPYARDHYARDPYSRDPYARDPYERRPPPRDLYERRPLRDPYSSSSYSSRDPYASRDPYSSRDPYAASDPYARDRSPPPPRRYESSSYGGGSPSSRRY